LFYCTAANQAMTEIGHHDQIGTLGSLSNQSVQSVFQRATQWRVVHVVDLKQLTHIARVDKTALAGCRCALAVDRSEANIRLESVAHQLFVLVFDIKGRDDFNLFAEAGAVVGRSDDPSSKDLAILI